MTRKDYLSAVAQSEVNEASIKKIQNQYGKTFPVYVQKVISFSVDSIFFDDGYRTLSLTEIINADRDLHVDFTGRKIIPVIDCGDNDFIIYHIQTNSWSKFNIVDELSFKEKSSLSELL